MSLVAFLRTRIQTKRSWTATEDPSLHTWEMTAVFRGISNSCDSCGIDVGYHCVTSLPTLKQINIGPSHRMLVEIESRRIWVRQQNNTKGGKKNKNVSLICSAVRGAEATGGYGCIIDYVEQQYAACRKW